MSDLSHLFKALSEGIRLRVLAMMHRYGELCVCEVERFLDVSQSTASRHLRYLAAAGWVEARREDQWVYYRITEPRDDEHRLLLDTLLKLLEGTEIPHVGDELEEMREARSRSPLGCASDSGVVDASAEVAR
ncbi:MAG: metalloregulator ArsR/SmtB family transcription factor [Gemmatimonadota bacterium]